MTDSSNALELHAGALRLALRPDLGGSIAGLWFDTTPVLRSTEPGELSQARLSASYPLLPYSNRIGNGRFSWLGRAYELPRNDNQGPHALHGVGFSSAWSVERAGAHDAVLTMQHAPNEGWPFAFGARQTFGLTPEALHCELSYTNQAAHAVPLGLGWHPYFPKRQRSRLHAELSGRWDADANKLPTKRVAMHGLDADIEHLDFDHCFDGWVGTARIRDERLALTLTSSLRHLVVYTPHDKDFYAVEPVSHVNNAINQPESAALGIQTLAPGATASAWMKLEIHPTR